MCNCTVIIVYEITYADFSYSFAGIRRKASHNNWHFFKEIPTFQAASSLSVFNQ